MRACFWKQKRALFAYIHHKNITMKYITGKGMKFRWLNNAGFEMELSSGSIM